MLKSIAQMPDAERPERNRKLRDQLTGMFDAIPPQMQDGEVLADFGNAWYALGNFHDAIECYREAVKKDDAKASIEAVQRLANFECRYAEKLWKQAEADKAPAGKAKTARGRKTPGEKEFTPGELLGEAEKRLDWLLELDRTPERLALKGRIYKTKALLAANKKERLARLSTAKGWYKEGYDESAKRNRAPKLYPTVNLIACGFLLGEKSGLESLLGDCEQMARREREKGDDFWARVAVPDVALLRHLVKGDLGQRQKSVLKSYREAFATGPKLNEADSVLTQMDFLIAMMESDGASPKGKSLAAAVRAIRDELRGNA
jgi:tetratricopeptide (TPR) repeat protein